MRRSIIFLTIILLTCSCTSSIYQLKYYPKALGYTKLRPSAVKIFVEDFKDERTLQERKAFSLRILFAEGGYDQYFVPPSEDLVKEALIEEINTSSVAQIVNNRQKADYIVDGTLKSFKKDLKVDYYPMWAETFNPGYAYNCDIYVSYATELISARNNQKVWENNFAGHYERKNKAMYLFHWPVVLARGCQEALSQAVSAHVMELAYILDDLENRQGN